MLRFSCPSCAQVMTADPAAAGCEATCRKCGARFVVPGPVRDSVDLDDSTADRVDPASDESRTDTSARAARRGELGGQVVAFVLGMFLMGALSFMARSLGFTWVP